MKKDGVTFYPLEADLWADEYELIDSAMVNVTEDQECIFCTLTYPKAELMRYDRLREVDGSEVEYYTCLICAYKAWKEDQES